MAPFVIFGGGAAPPPRRGGRRKQGQRRAGAVWRSVQGCCSQQRSALFSRARRPVRAFSTSSPRPFRKRPMKPAYRDSWMCRKTLIAEIQSGASNVSMSDPSRLPNNLCEPHAARKTERIWPLEQLNMATRAALSPFDSWRVSPNKRKRRCTIMVEAGTVPLDAIGRPHDLDLGGHIRT